LKFSPGLVGGHCIGVDPYYLTHKAQQAGYHSKVITSGRYVNDSMGFYIGKQTVKKIIAQGKHIQDAKVLVMGVTFKEDVSDIRNSKVIDVINELKSFQVSVDLVDPHASSTEMTHEYGVGLLEKPSNDYDAIIVAVNHKEYSSMNENDFKNLLKDKAGVFVDVKGIFRNKIKELEYWSL
jgi:UDP-N-acetyl-D-galactosamine dehydrogenase